MLYYISIAAREHVQYKVIVGYIIEQLFGQKLYLFRETIRKRVVKCTRENNQSKFSNCNHPIGYKYISYKLDFIIKKKKCFGY